MFREILSKRYEQPFLIVIVILLGIIAVYNWIVSLLSLIIIGGVYVLFRKNVLEGNKEMNQFFNAISQSVDQASNYAVQNLPIGIAIIDTQSTLCWANSVFLEWIKNIDENQDLQAVMPNLKTDKFWGKFGYFFEHIEDKYFRVVYKYLQPEEENGQDYLILYFENITESESQKLACFNAMPVFCDIEIDNLEEVSKGLTDVQKATLWTDVNNCLLDEMTAVNGFIRSYGEDNYICCLSRQALDVLKANNFSFLEKIRAIHTVNRVPVTISMGVASFSRDVIETGVSSFNELAEQARSGLDLALGRGGDQVVVYDEDSPGEGSAGGGSEPAVPPVPTADAIVIPDKTVLPEIHEEYTKEPERQQNYREVHEGNVFGRGGAGNGTGVGTGNKNGPGDGNAAGGSQASAAKPAAPAPVVPASVPAPPPPPPAPKQRVQATCIGTAMPVYPADLQEEGVEGAVTVKIYVDTDGSVERVEVTGSSGYGELDNAAAAAAARFRFSASDSKGYWTKTFIFRLTGA